MNHLNEIIIREAFYQKFPLTLDRFIDYCKNRDLLINRKFLENLDEEGIFKPIMRIHGSDVNNTTDLKEMYQHESIDDPHLIDFIPWDNFYRNKDGLKQEIIHSYYHPYQIYFLKEILNIQMKLSPFNFPQEDDDLLKNVRKWEEFLKKRLETLGQDATHDKFVELLIFIQNKYLPLVKQSGHIIVTGDIYDSMDNIEKWNELQEKIIPEEIIRTLDLEAEEIKRYRESIGGQGLSIDPMERWYDLIKYIKYDERQKLKGKALLAQDFFIISDMLRLFLEDLTGNKQLETGSIFDSMQGRGKLRIYGKELNYIDRDVLIKILREFGINPKPRLVLIVEGYTEETAFPIIANSMDIPLDRFDIEIINIRGINKDPRELLIYHSTPDIYQIEKESYIHPERTKIFIILDNEGGKNGWFINPKKEIEKMMREVLSIIEKRLNKKVSLDKIFFENTVKYNIWDNNFEYDNFSNEELSRELNTYGEKYSHHFNVTPDEIEECREKNKNLDKFIREKTDDTTSLNKKEFGFQLANMVADEIKNRKDKFDNQRPIEKILDNLVRFTIKNP